MTERVLLSFDVEEFDLPLEFGREIALETQQRVGAKGFERVLAQLEAQRVVATLFTTAVFASAHETMMKRAVASGHEIASHGFSHTTRSDDDYGRARAELERVSGTRITGFRMPRLASVSLAKLREVGYTYDSSLNPTWIPGRYDGRKLPRVPFVEDGLVRIPAAVTPRARLPLFWLSFKNVPLALYKRWASAVLADTGVLALYFHPWEFTDLKSWGLPLHVRRVDGARLVDRLAHFIDWLKPLAAFCTYGAVAREYGSRTEGVRTGQVGF